MQGVASVTPTLLLVLMDVIRSLRMEICERYIKKSGSRSCLTLRDALFFKTRGVFVITTYGQV